MTTPPDVCHSVSVCTTRRTSSNPPIPSPPTGVHAGVQRHQAVRVLPDGPVCDRRASARSLEPAQSGRGPDAAPGGPGVHRPALAGAPLTGAK